MRFFLLLVFVFGFVLTASSQLVQVGRYELEKKNTDDYFTVITTGKQGLVIIRDTDEYRKKEGNVWEIIALDTIFCEKWKHDLAIDIKYIFKGYEVRDNHLFLLFVEGERTESDYHVITIAIDNGDIKRYDINNEIALELSHLIVVDNYLILGGYVRYSPTFVSYSFATNKMTVIPGFFKDRSDIVNLHSNNNGTFNILTLEKAYDGYHLKLRTHSPKGHVLFEKTVEFDRGYKVLNGVTSDFVNGNIVISGTYGNSASFYSQGIYLAVVKPEGQKNIVRFHSFPKLEHFFDYMGERRAARIKKRIDKKESQGKEYKYASRLLLHDIRSGDDGYVVSAEIYDPQSQDLRNSNFNFPYGYGYGGADDAYRQSNAAQQRYVKRSGMLSHADGANHFTYKASIMVKLDKNGELLWDNSFKIDDVETFSLEPVVDYSGSNDVYNMLYKSNENINYKIIDQAEALNMAQEGLWLPNEYDEVKHTYEGVGGTVHWYDNFFFVWGYHRIENKINPEVEKKRSVLFVNKIMFEN